jgi:hypothetical protein
MRNTRGIAAFAGAFLTVSAAWAQQSSVFTLSAADSATFRTWVGTQKVVAVPAPAGFTVSVGAVVPEAVTFYEIPTTVGVTSVTKYRYAMIGDKLVLVDPTDRKIVYIVG